MNQSRTTSLEPFVLSNVAIVASLILYVIFAALSQASGERPNIIILLTDDQGYGDLGHHGNTDIKTPNIDWFAQESVVFERFYVSPVCAPTRASLLTGRYNYRTGVTDTWKGGATMHQDEYTLAEALSAAGYVTGLFGKWHLGDNYPYRPQDQGFKKVLMHPGGGIGQPSDVPGNSYFDPTLLEDGVQVKFSGYCMDVYTDAALEFIEANKESPFFVYLATNTPHTPLQVPETYQAPYLAAGLPEKTSKIYGMISNIDHNFKRVLDKLDALSLSNNTIVIFMSDNGPKIFSARRHRAGLRGEKTDIYEGGIRSPFFMRWPERFKQSQTIAIKAAHIDIMPTVLAATRHQYALPAAFDGRNLLPLIEDAGATWAERTLYFQWHRGYKPNKFQNFTAIGSRYKLLQASNKFDKTQKPVFELYDLEEDPGETRNIAATQPKITECMRAEYLDWLNDVSNSRGYPEMPAWVGSPRENPTLLTHQDRRGTGSWGNDSYHSDNYWPIRILHQGTYRILLDLYAPIRTSGIATIKIGDKLFDKATRKGDTTVKFESIFLEKQDARLSAWVDTNNQKKGPRFVEIEHLDNTRNHN